MTAELALTASAKPSILTGNEAATSEGGAIWEMSGNHYLGVVGNEEANI